MSAHVAERDCGVDEYDSTMRCKPRLCSPLGFYSLFCIKKTFCVVADPLAAI